MNTGKRVRRQRFDDAPIFIRLTSDQRKRLRHAAVDHDCSYAELIMFLLDDFDRRRQAAPSPLHRIDL